MRALFLDFFPRRLRRRIRFRNNGLQNGAMTGPIARPGVPMAGDGNSMDIGSQIQLHDEVQI